MSEFDSHDPLEVYIRQVQEQENKSLEASRESFLEGHFFTDDFLNTSHDPENIATILAAEQMRSDFYHEKKGKNFGECFDLAVNKYLNKIDVVELGIAKGGGINALNSLRQDYSDLQSWLHQHGLIHTIFSDHNAGTKYITKSSSVCPPEKSGIARRLVLMRIRPLLVGGITNSAGSEAVFEQAKVSVFSMSSQLYATLGNKYGVQKINESSGFRQHMDELIDESGDMPLLLAPIRTAYYQATRLVESRQDATLEA